ARKRPATGATTRGGVTIKAKFPGRCPCGKPYAAGEKITKLGTRWGHPGCAAAPSEDA
ncbi:ribonuclease HI, partial [Streptomyces bambusae]|nr:ribonuclease HI [Streptomyces bambusae]